MGPLREEEKGGDGKAGGGGGLTEDRVNQLINGALSRVERKHDAATAAFAEKLTAITSAIEGLAKPPEKTTEKKEGDKGGDPKENAEIVRLTKLVENLAKKAEADEQKAKRAEEIAAKKDLELQVSTAVAGIEFASDGTRKLFTEHLKSVAKREEGSDDLTVETKTGPIPLPDYAKQYLGDNLNLLAPKAAGGGTGAGKGSPASKGAPTTEMIVPGMSAEVKTALHSQIRKALTGE